MLISAFLVFLTPPQAQMDLRAWGLETLKTIQRDLYLPDKQLYGEEAKPEEPPKNVAFTWSVGVMLQALNSGAEADPSFVPVLKQYVDAVQSYWNPIGPVPGFDVLPGPKPVDRYYDDNEWMVIALAQSAKVLHSSHALQMAKDAFVYVMSGKDSKLGGGIYWRESDKASKNTCSNAPAAAAALALFAATKDVTYVRIAEELYAWTKAHLRDPADGLYWDSVNLDGKIGTAKWSYNTGLMLRAAADLYRVTKKLAYANDTRDLQTASLKHWVGADGSLKDEGKFMHLLLENWLLAYRLVPGTDDPRPAIVAGLKRLHDVSRDSLGHYGGRWDRPAGQTPFSPFALIDQASAARAFLQAAE